MAPASRVLVRGPHRAIALPPRLITLLTEHQAAQRREHEAAGELWEEHGFVFTGPTGRPLDPRADNREWAELLKEAGVREARLHDARHTAATVLQMGGIASDASFDGSCDCGVTRACGVGLALSGS